MTDYQAGIQKIVVVDPTGQPLDYASGVQKVEVVGQGSSPQTVERLDQLDSEVNQLTSDLAEKANETDLANGLSQKRDKSTKVQMEDMSDTVISAISGGTTVNVLSIPQFESVTKERLAKQSVTPDRTSFVGVGKNKFNVNYRSVLGEWCNYTNGVIESNQYVTTFYHSHAYAVNAGDTYTRRYGSDGTVFFDSNMSFVSGTQANTYTVPSNAVWVIYNFQNYHLDEQVELGSVSTEYEGYRPLIDGLQSNNAFFDEPIIKNPTFIGFTIPKDESLYEITLPFRLYSVVGKEMNIYFDNTIIGDAKDYHFDVVGARSDVGRHEESRFTTVPSASIVGENYMVFYNYNKYEGDDNKFLNKKECYLVVAAVNKNSGITKKYMTIGDSTTKGMIDIGVLAENFTNDVMDVTLVGTQGSGANKCEAYPGKDTAFLCENASSPFSNNGAFDFAYYVANQGIIPDIVDINFGINDMYGCGNDTQALARIDQDMARYEQMITSIHAYNPNIIIGIVVPIPPSISQDSFGDINNDPIGRTRNRHKRNMLLWAKRVISQFANREGNKIYVVNYGACLDTVNNMVQTSVPINSRNSTMVMKQTNSLHPAPSGYAQMADARYYWVKNMSFS